MKIARNPTLTVRDIELKMELEFRNMLNDLQVENLADGYHDQTSARQQQSLEQSSLKNSIKVSRTGLLNGTKRTRVVPLLNVAKATHINFNLNAMDW